MDDQQAGTVEAYCRGCDYMLRGIGDTGKCPECGRDFDLNNPQTWTRYPRRRRVWRMLRWPVSFLLLLVLASAGGVGWLYWDWRSEQAVIQWVKDQRGHVSTRPIGPTWVKERAGRWAWLLERADRVDVTAPVPVASPPPLWQMAWAREVWLWEEGVTDEWIAALARVRTLESLTLINTRVGDEGLQRLGHRQGLLVLGLASPLVSDEGLAVLANFPNLKGLGWGGKQIRGDGLVHLRHVPKLEVLYLNATSVVDEALAAVGQRHALKRLELWGTQVTSAGMAHLSRLNQLEYMNLSNTALDDAAVEHLAKLTSLKTLFVQGTQMTLAGVDRLREALPNTVISSDYGTWEPAPRAGE
jgi:hypothetical protein